MIVKSIARAGYGLLKMSRRRLSRRRSDFSISNCAVVVDSAYRNAFCGYYDYSAFCPTDSSLLLVHFTNHPVYRAPNKASHVNIAIYDWKLGIVVESIGRSRAWNWQQGSKATWVGSDRWIYNVYNSGTDEYESHTGRLGETNGAILPHPFQACDQNGNFYSIDYKSLAAIRPDYGYFCHKGRGLKSGKVFKFRLDDPQGVLFLDERELNAHSAMTMKGERDRGKINHILPSPNGEWVLFMHRYYVGGDRITDVYAKHVVTGRLFSLLHNCGTSHYCWVSDRAILATSKEHVEGGFGYIQIQYDDGIWVTSFLKNTIDGHPHTVEGDKFLSDSYADAYGIRRLWSADVVSEFSPSQVGEFIEPWYLWGSRRCDLHPTVSSDKEYWQVDCLVKNRRCVCVGRFGNYSGT